MATNKKEYKVVEAEKAVLKAARAYASAMFSMHVGHIGWKKALIKANLQLSELSVACIDYDDAIILLEANDDD